MEIWDAMCFLLGYYWRKWTRPKDMRPKSELMSEAMAYLENHPADKELQAIYNDLGKLRDEFAAEERKS
jgi:hypothetical protein